MKSFIFLVALLNAISAFAYIPPVRSILEKVSDNAGNGTYVIEQEVQLNTGLDPVYLKETWVVENEKNLKVTVTGTKEYKDLVKMQFVYVGGQKWQLVDGKRESTKIPEEFAEKYFNTRNTESLISSFQNLKILPSPLPHRKTLTKDGKPEKPETEPFLRLSRTEGVINYALGTPTPAGAKELNPGVWVEQDAFVIRKIRFPTQSEITAESYASFARGLNFPKTRTIQWGSNTVYLRVLNVSGKANESFQPSSVEIPRTIRVANNPAVQSMIEEFYTRFR
jgi:hypothetical protein